MRACVRERERNGGEIWVLHDLLWERLVELIDSCGSVEAVRLLRLAIKRGAGGFGEHLQGIDRQGRWQAHGLEPKSWFGN